MSAKKESKKLVKELVKDFSGSKSPRFKASEFEALFYAVLTDETHAAKRLTYDLKNKKKDVEEVNYNQMFKNFLDGIFKSAGVKAEEREALVNSYEPKSKDIKFFIDAVEEAERQYLESGKALKKWATHEVNLILRKYERKGKYEGEITISRKLVDREKAIKKS